MAGDLGSPGCVACPLPFREPVSAAFTLATEFHHAPAALWADQVDDRRNDACIEFPWHRLDSSHPLLSYFTAPVWRENSSLQLREAQPRGPRTTVTCHGCLRFQALRAGSLRSLSSHLYRQRLAHCLT
jgi:hypothetical protein